MSLTVGTTISHFFHPSPFTSSSSSSFSAMNQEWLLGESINFNKNKKLSFSGVGKSYDNEAKVLKNHERVNGFDGCSDTPTLYTPSPKPSQTSLLNTALKQTDCCERCAGCDGAITDKFMLHSMGSFWHDDCLKCACCDCRLGEVGSTLYSKAELLLCKRDYLRLFGATGNCGVCGKVIPAFEMVMRSVGNVYHLDCFACQQCHHRFCIGDQYHIWQNTILCPHHYQAVLFVEGVEKNHNNKNNDIIINGVRERGVLEGYNGKNEGFDNDIVVVKEKKGGEGKVGDDFGADNKVLKLTNKKSNIKNNKNRKKLIKNNEKNL